MVECNDDGAEFVTARVNCSLSEILEHPDIEMLRRFIPIEVVSRAAGRGRLLFVQVNLFECGGLAIGLSMSHKIADASTICTFINCWSAIALRSSETDQVLMLPEFGAASLFPPKDFSSSTRPPAREVIRAEGCITKRYVFDASKISALQSSIASPAVPKPTRLEAVSALIWKCAIEASARSKLGTQTRSVFLQAVNLRQRVAPPLPENLAGNAVGSFTASNGASEESSVIDLKELVAKLREGIGEVKQKYGTKVLVFDSNEAWQEIKEKQSKLKEVEVYRCTCWCRFPVYEADFGWGKPSWTSSAPIGIENWIALFDKRDCRGIEAWLTTREEKMALFEKNVQLLEYASVDPGVI